VFRDIVFPDGSVSVPEDVPPLYRANFATAMLLTNRIGAGMYVLEHMNPDEYHPYADRLLAAVRQWKNNLSLIERIGCAVGWYPKKPPTLDFPLGEM